MLRHRRPSQHSNPIAAQVDIQVSILPPAQMKCSPVTVPIKGLDHPEQEIPAYRSNTAVGQGRVGQLHSFVDITSVCLRVPTVRCQLHLKVMHDRPQNARERLKRACSRLGLNHIHGTFLLTFINIARYDLAVSHEGFMEHLMTAPKHCMFSNI